MMDVKPLQSVMGGGSPTSGDIAIKIDDVHQDHEQKRRQR
jgi:hypothetical protein